MASNASRQEPLLTSVDHPVTIRDRDRDSNAASADGAESDELDRISAVTIATTPSQRWGCVFALFVLATMLQADIFILPYLFALSQDKGPSTSIRNDLSLTETEFGLLTSYIGIVPRLVVIIATGRVSAFYPSQKRHLVLASGFTLVGGMALYYIATNFATLVPAIILMNIGVGLNTPMNAILIGDIFDRSSRAMPIACVVCADYCGAGLAGLAGALALHSNSWRKTVLVYGAASVVALVLASALVTQTRGLGEDDDEVVGSRASSLGVVGRFGGGYASSLISDDEDDDEDGVEDDDEEKVERRRESGEDTQNEGGDNGQKYDGAKSTAVGGKTSTPEATSSALGVVSAENRKTISVDGSVFLPSLTPSSPSSDQIGGEEEVKWIGQSKEAKTSQGSGGSNRRSSKSNIMRGSNMSSGSGSSQGDTSLLSDGSGGRRRRRRRSSGGFRHHGDGDDENEDDDGDAALEKERFGHLSQICCSPFMLLIYLGGGVRYGAGMSIANYGPQYFSTVFPHTYGDVYAIHATVSVVVCGTMAQLASGYVTQHFLPGLAVPIITCFLGGIASVGLFLVPNFNGAIVLLYATWFLGEGWFVGVITTLQQGFTPGKARDSGLGLFFASSVMIGAADVFATSQGGIGSDDFEGDDDDAGSERGGDDDDDDDGGSGGSSSHHGGFLVWLFSGGDDGEDDSEADKDRARKAMLLGTSAMYLLAGAVFLFAMATPKKWRFVA